MSVLLAKVALMGHALLMNGADIDDPVAFRAARKLASTLFEGGVDGPVWNLCAQGVADGACAEDMVQGRVEKAKLFPSERLQATLVLWLEETAAELETH